MKTIQTKFLTLITALLAMVSLGPIACSSSYNLTNPPSGFVFTDSNGTIITTSNSNSPVQLRTSNGQTTLFQFEVNADVNFQNVIAARNLNNTVVHFPSSSDKVGINGTVTLLTPCNPGQNTVRVCPSATATSDVAPSCTNQILLTTTDPASGNYTWANPDRGGLSDCQIQADISNFNTGGSGTIIFPYYFNFQPPEGYEGDPAHCTLACDDPIIRLGGVEMSYQANDLLIPSSTSSLEGYNFYGTEQESASIPLDPDFIANNLDPLPTFIWTFVDASNVTLDLYSYNFLLEGESTPLPRCEFQCELFPGNVPGTFDFSLNGSDQIGYMVPGYSANNVFFVNPFETPNLSSVKGGNVGISTLVITSTFDGDPIYPLDFTLGEDDFATVTGFQVMDINNGVENTVTLNQSSVLGFSNTGSLQIMGESLDTVVMSDASAWTDAGVVTINGNTFTQYKNGGAILLVQTGVKVEL